MVAALTLETLSNLVDLYVCDSDGNGDGDGDGDGGDCDGFSQL